MPMKYRPTEKTFNRSTRQTTTTHHYMHTIPTSQLIQDIKDARRAPKHLQKIRNELVRRGVTTSA